MNVFTDTVVAFGNMSTLTEHLGPVRVGELNKVMVVNLTMVLSSPNQSAALPLCRHRKAIHQPVDHVEVMDVLFHDMVAAEPVKVIPVSHLVFQFRLVIGPGTHPNTPRRSNKLGSTQNRR